MKVGLDTSVVLRLLLGEPPEQSTRAVAFLDDVRRRGDQAVISDLVAAETYFALQHHYGVSKRDALMGLRRLLVDGEIAPLGSLADVLAVEGLATAKPGFVDRLIHAAYLSGSAEMASFEKAAGRLPSARVI
jgi:predicted nucleic-acid-binding protein